MPARIIIVFGVRTPRGSRARRMRQHGGEWEKDLAGAHPGQRHGPQCVPAAGQSIIKQLFPQRLAAVAAVLMAAVLVLLVRRMLPMRRIAMMLA